MIELGKTLIVDDSKVYRKLLATLLRPYVSSVLIATTVGETLAILASESEIDVIVCDVKLGEEDGFEILEHVSGCPAPRPRVIMVSGYLDGEEPERAARLGALGFLRKPTRLREFAALLQTVPHAERQLNPRFRCAGVAYVVEPGANSGEHLAWDVYNLGPEGAFLETKGPLPVGEELDLLLDVGGREARVCARVVRVQEPSWLNVGGVGVTFIDADDAARASIDAALADALARGSEVDTSTAWASAALQRAPEEPSASVLDESVLGEIRALDPDGAQGLLDRVAQAYGATTPVLLEDLRRAHEKGDATAMAAAAHALKSSSNSLGARRLAEICDEIESIGRAASVEGAATLLEALAVESEQVSRAVAAQRRS